MQQQIPVFERSVGLAFKTYLIDIFKHRQRILDLGCGIGAYLEIFGKMGVGADISIPDLRVAKKKGLNVIKADMNRGLPFRDGSFNIALLSHILEHVYSPIHLLREVNRVLSERGRIVIGLPVENSLANLLGKDRYFAGHDGHFYSFSPENTKVLLNKAGFLVERKPVVEPWPAGQLQKMRLLEITKRLVQFLPISVSLYFSNGYWTVGVKNT